MGILAPIIGRSIDRIGVRVYHLSRRNCALFSALVFWHLSRAFKFMDFGGLGYSRWELPPVLLSQLLILLQLIFCRQKKRFRDGRLRHSFRPIQQRRYCFIWNPAECIELTSFSSFIEKPSTTFSGYPNNRKHGHRRPTDETDRHPNSNHATKLFNGLSRHYDSVFNIRNYQLNPVPISQGKTRYLSYVMFVIMYIYLNKVYN